MKWRLLIVLGVLSVVTIVASRVQPVFADRFTSTNYRIDAGVAGNSVGDGFSSTNYGLVAAGGESVIGEGSGGSYKLGQGYVAQLDSSLQLSVQSGNSQVYYAFEEGAGTVANDFAGSNESLSFSGTPTWTTGKIGGGIATSSGNYLQSSSSSPLSGSQMTTCAWGKINSTGTEPTIVAQSDATLSTSGMWSLGFNTTGTRLQAKMNLGGTVYTLTGSTSVGTGTWVHACLNFNGTTMRLFQNGASTASNSVTFSYSYPSTNITVGARSGGSNPLDGAVDEIKNISIAQTAAVIQTMYNAEALGVPAALTFPPLTPNTSVTRTLTMTIRSDAQHYDIGVVQDHDLQKGVDTISSVSGSIASPVTWVEGTTKGLGFTITSINPGSVPGKWSSGNAYAAFPGTMTTFIPFTASSGSEVIMNMRLRLDVPISQVEGDYQNTATWQGTITP